MSVVLCENLISRRRSRRNPAGVGLPPSLLQLVPVTRIEEKLSNKRRRQLGLEMTNRVGSSSGGNQNFPTTGRPPDRDWMDMKRIRPTWTGNGTRNMMDSGIEFTENQYGPQAPQTGGRKRHADHDMLQRSYANIPDSTRRMPWDGQHKRILFESEDPDSTVSGGETQDTIPGWPPDDMCADSTQYRRSFDDRDHEGLRLLSPMLQQRVLKLQRDLEEAKAESRYFRAKRLENPVVTRTDHDLRLRPCRNMQEGPTGTNIVRCFRQ